MTSADQKVWDDAITFLQGIDKLGFGKVQKQLDFIVTDADKTKFVNHMKAADPCAAAMNPAWKNAARAWLMYKLAVVCTNGYFDPPDPIELGNFVGAITPKTADGIASLLASELSGKAITDAIANALNSTQRNAWDIGAFSEPAQHTTAKFRYIIYSMVSSISYSDSDQIAYTQQQGRGSFVGNGIMRIAELYFSKPSILQTEVICCSVVDQDKTTTYRGSTFGFVLKVPKQNLVTAFDSDASTSPKISRARGDALSKIKQQEGKVQQIDQFLSDLSGYYQADLSTPDEILAASKQKEGHNELVVMGATPGAFTMPNGIFVKTTKTDGKLAKEFVDLDQQWGLTKLMKGCAAQLKIPFINIPDTKVEPSSVDFDTWRA